MGQDESGRAGGRDIEGTQVPGDGGAEGRGRVAAERPTEAAAQAAEGAPTPAPARSRRAFVAAGALALAALAGGLAWCSRPARSVSSVVGPAVDAAGSAAEQALRDGRQAAAVLDEPRGVVCVDPGHGAIADLSQTPVGPGSDETQYVEPGGATGVATGVPEYEVTLEVGLALRDALEARGVQVVMTRETNDVVMSSEERAQVANDAGADLFVRLHCDGEDDESLSGFSTLVPGVNEWTGPIYEASLHAAEVMHPLVVAAIGAQDRGIVERPDLAGFNFCSVPSVLFEMGFLSNPEEDELLNDPSYQQLLADALADAICAYLDDVKG